MGYGSTVWCSVYRGISRPANQARIMIIIIAITLLLLILFQLLLIINKYLNPMFLYVTLSLKFRLMEE